MPYLDKHTISQYFRTSCKKQLKLGLYPPDNSAYSEERAKQNMPPKQKPRPGLQNIKQAGIDWEIAKYTDLRDSYGEYFLLGKSKVDEQGRVVYSSQFLADILLNSPVYSFLVQAKYDIRIKSTFEEKLGISRLRNLIEDMPLKYGHLIPDIIQVLPANTYNTGVTPDGIEFPIVDSDNRIQLKIIDIKNTAEPSAAYFGEVAYYMMTLAGWLMDEKLDDRYIVVRGAVWPGSHEASLLRKRYMESTKKAVMPAVIELNSALNEDLQEAPFSVFSIRIRHFFVDELEEILKCNWKDIPYHVSNICTGCDYLGYPWISKGELTNHKDHCMPTSERNEHLSRIAQLTPGASEALNEQGVNNVSNLANISADNKALETHQTLKAKRGILPARAQALVSSQVIIPKDVGTSSILPKWADLSIYITLDFDITSGITAAFGLKGFWIEKQNINSENRKKLCWPKSENGISAYSFVVDQRDVNSERRELINFLMQLQQIIDNVKELDEDSTYQVYIWDEIQLKHLQRIIGRHLSNIVLNPTISDLIWLFPPEDVMKNSELQRPSPLTVVKEVINNVTALPIPHYYSLLRVARTYADPNNSKIFNVHPLFEDVLSDQIPSERIHEIWSRSTTLNHHWNIQLNIFNETVKKRVAALEAITYRIQTELRPQLQENAPKIKFNAPKAKGKMSIDGELLYAYTRLDVKINELEILGIRAMPPYEREARFHSAILERRVRGEEEKQILENNGLTLNSRRRVYMLSSNSKSVKLKEGDYLFALSPNCNASFLNQSFYYIMRNNPELQETSNFGWKMESVTSVTIIKIDRENGFVIIDIQEVYGKDRIQRNYVDEMEKKGIANFEQNVSLDPVYKDYFLNKLLGCLQSIGNPAIANRDENVLKAMGLMKTKGARKSQSTPVAEFLWKANELQYEESQWLSKDSILKIEEIRTIIESQGIALNSTQWKAWEYAIGRKLQVIWGPPGTGKSRTLRAIILGLLECSLQFKKPVRILICASTYTAIDNVLLDTYNELVNSKYMDNLVVARLRSTFATPLKDSKYEAIDREVNRYNPSEDIEGLINRLNNCEGNVIVAATPEQVYNLTKINEEQVCEFFDYILIDEASQMDVAHAVLPLCAICENGNLILAGDSKQLPPITKVEAPLGLENKVGSIYNYMTKQYQVEEIMLDINYRSAKTIVDFALEAGYMRSLTSYSPDLKLNLVEELASERPVQWPNDLEWSINWTDIMNNELRAACFVYSDGKSSQWNDFEIEAVAALITSVYGKVGKQLVNEIDILGNVKSIGSEKYDTDEFWKKGIGVVTPHRAQQSRIVSRLQQLFGHTVNDITVIRDAVDTVERFQGQERDIIIVSFALGDIDMIRTEEEFLMSLNRFNVMASRARAKLVVLVSQEIIDYLGSDINILNSSELIKKFADTFCDECKKIVLPYRNNDTVKRVEGYFKYRI